MTQVATPSAFERWRRLVESRRRQMDAAYERLRRTSADFWTQRADAFQRRVGVMGEDDPLVRRVLALLPEGGSVLDVGAGTGRFAVPIARHAGRLVAVEPSREMAGHLRANAREHGLGNIEPIESGWLERQETVPPADVVLCAHVLYPHADIEAWLRTLDAHARLAVVLTMMGDWNEPPILMELWQRFHGESRVLQPTYFDAFASLREMGIYANVEVQPVGTTLWRFETLDEAVEAAREHLLLPGTPEVDAALREGLEANLVRTEQGLSLPSRRVAGIVWWQTDDPRLR
jgi:SAM-dependent methyltransferase